jgi:cobalt-zinc-cadmium efflux system protein
MGNCTHSHGPGGQHIHGPTSGTKLWISLLVTLAFVAFEALAGWRASSLALLSDAAHNLSANSASTFGYHRVAILTALFNACTLVLLAAGIGLEAVQRFRVPTPVGGDLMIWVAVVAVVMNTAIAAALSGDAKNSLNSRAAYVHMAGDALSSLAVVIAGVVVHYTGWLYADPLVSSLIAVFIAATAWGIVRDAVDVLLENTPRGIDVDALVASIKEIPSVTGMHDLHIWQVSDGLRFLSCHVQVPADLRISECSEVVEAINRRLQHSFGIGHATIQLECEGFTHSRCSALYCAMQTGDHHSHSHDHDHPHIGAHHEAHAH